MPELIGASKRCAQGLDLAYYGGVFFRCTLPRVASIRLLLPLLFEVGGGCRRGIPSDNRSDSSTGAISAESAVALVPLAQLVTPPVFSAPIAAVRIHGELVVGGLVASEGIVRLIGLREGMPAWSADVLRDVAWGPDAEIKMQAAADGVAVEWRGSYRGKVGSQAVLVGPRGGMRGAPLAIGAASCATDDGLAWVDPRDKTGWHVRARRWTDVSPHDVLTLPLDRTPTLSCGKRDAFLLGDGDDDLTVAAFSPGADADAPVTAIRNRDFGDDDERDHDAFAVGNTLDVLRVGQGGSIAIREIERRRATPWRRMKHNLSADDDLVAVDGDGAFAILVVTREGEHACPGADSPPVGARAFRIGRTTTDEATVPLAPAECESTPGPFWIAGAPGGTVVAWARRKARPGTTSPPIIGFAYRFVTVKRGRVVTVDLAADALVDAGCDETACFAAALVRDVDGGSVEGAIRGIRYAEHAEDGGPPPP